MIITEIYNGQGFGNQLWCYVTTRVIAADKKRDFGIQCPEKFKGHDFMTLDFGKRVEGGYGPEGGPPEVLPKDITNYYAERAIVHPLNGSDVRTYDSQLVNVPDGTKIDGCMQDEKYIEHRKNEIRDWLKVKPEYECHDFADDNICVINFRGSGYVKEKYFFLPPKYWENAIRQMRKINANFKFVVVTEDVVTAKTFFPEFDVFHWSIAKDYVVIKNAHYLILSNSSFAWFPAWLNTNLKFCIAPKYWARHNVSDGYWSLGYNITKGWHYLDRRGNLLTYEECLSELKSYEKAHPDIFTGKLIIKKSFSQGLKNGWNIFRTLSRDSNPVQALYKMTIMALLEIPYYYRNLAVKIKLRLLKKPSQSGITPPEERHVFDLLKDRCEVIFDVGAREELSFYEMKPDAEFHLFEPNPFFVDILKEKISKLKGARITLNPVGLSDKSGEAAYNEETQSFTSNRYQPSKFKRISLPLKTVDEYVKENDLKKIDFLKIDAEGLDFKIILGAMEVIKAGKVSFIQFEYWDAATKFNNLLKDQFRLFLQMEPRLLSVIQNSVYPFMTSAQKNIDFSKSLVECTSDVLFVIDSKLSSSGHGGNILAINKKVPDEFINKLIFDIKPAPKPISKIIKAGAKARVRSWAKSIAVRQGYY